MLRSLLPRRANDNQAGPALPLFGLMVFVRLGFVAMSIDVGRYAWAGTSMQAGVDAAAIAAARGDHHLRHRAGRRRRLELPEAGR